MVLLPFITEVYWLTFNHSNLIAPDIQKVFTGPQNAYGAIIVYCRNFRMTFITGTYVAKLHFLCSIVSSVISKISSSCCHELKIDLELKLPCIFRCIRFDAKRIVSGAYDGKIKVWDLVAAMDPRAPSGTLCVRTLVEHSGRVFRLQFDEFQVIPGVLRRPFLSAIIFYRFRPLDAYHSFENKVSHQCKT